MDFLTTKQPLEYKEQKILQAFGRTSSSRKSNLAIESRLTLRQIDKTVKKLVQKGLVKTKPAPNSQFDEYVYLTDKGNSARRKMHGSTVKYKTPVEPNIDQKLRARIGFH